MISDLSKEWALPPDPTPMLDQGELLLLDWIICSASRLLPDAGLDELVVKWHDTRVRVWEALRRFQEPGTTEVPFPLEDAEAKVILACCPTTFRWGVGPDSGYSLKLKLLELFAPKGEKR